MERILELEPAKGLKYAGFAKQQKDPSFLGENVDVEPFYEAFWNEGKGEQKLDQMPGDLIVVERGGGSGRQTAGCWGVRQGWAWCWGGLRGELSSCVSGRSVALRISWDCLGVWVQTRKTSPWLQTPGGYQLFSTSPTRAGFKCSRTQPCRP